MHHRDRIERFGMAANELEGVDVEVALGGVSHSVGFDGWLVGAEPLD